MATPLLRPQSAPLRFIAARLALPDMPQVARQAGIMEAFRITIQYHDGRVPDQVATLTRRQNEAQARLAVLYRRAVEPLQLDYAITIETFQAFSVALRKLGFDKIDDAPNVPWYGADLWLVERAAGAFHHDVIIAPSQLTGIYADMMACVNQYLKEAIRTVNP